MNDIKLKYPAYFVSSEPNHFRLNQSGFTKLSETMKPFKFELTGVDTSSDIIFLSKINFPFYLNKRNTLIYLFSEEEAFVVQIVGNIKEWLVQRN